MGDIKQTLQNLINMLMEEKIIPSFPEGITSDEEIEAVQKLLSIIEKQQSNVCPVTGCFSHLKSQQKR